jgi:uncharacterized membrane protein YphA (DoxX/SURF4 family)
MFQSIRASEIALRAGLAIVFIWFGIHKFIEPQYWLDTWIPDGIEAFAQGLRIAPHDLVYLMGLFEVLVALSLATGFFMRYFAIAAGVFLLSVMATHGFSEVAVRDVGLLGGLVSLVLWPRRTYA